MRLNQRVQLMFKRTDKTHPSIWLLADNLDAALAMGEDLTQQAWSPPSSTTTDQTDMRGFLEDVRTLEMTMIARILRAREHAAEAGRDKRLTHLARLFLAGTVSLLDALADLGDCTALDFDTGDAASAFLRTRGFIDADVPGRDEAAGLAVSQDYLVAGRIHLGTLMDLVATFLDVLEAHYDVYGDAALQGAGGEFGSTLGVQAS